MDNLEKLVQRLESATHRLETLSLQKPALAPKPPTGQQSSPPPDDAVPAMVTSFDDAINEPLQCFMSLSAKLGGDVNTMANKVKSAFAAQRQFLWSAAGQKRPVDAQLQSMLQPVAQLIEDIGTFCVSKRNTPQFNHLSAISEGIQAIGWVTVTPTPAPFVKDMYEAAMFFVNRVLKDHRDDATQVDWTKSWQKLLMALQQYVKQTHTTGLVWNSSPGSAAPTGAATTMSTNGSASRPPTGAPPPPPPALPSNLFDNANKGVSGDAREALFSDLSKGLEITKGLKKVTADMQTHKNPSLKVSGAISATPSVDIDRSSSIKSTNNKDPPPKTILENGKQWNVEYHKSNKSIIIEVADMKQTVYVYKCIDSVIQIKGKVNSVTIDSCKKTSVVFDNLLSQVEIINCQSIQIQTLGALPTLSIQKTDGCQVYLSKQSLDAEIVTSKSSEMNILVPTDDGDFHEYPVPEQFKTVWNGKKLNTSAVDIA